MSTDAGGVSTVGGAPTGSGGLSSSGGTGGGAGGQSASGGADGGDGGASSGGTSSGGAQGSGGGTSLAPAPSCAGLTGNECQGDDCCETLLVPGGTIDVDGADYELPSFYLDKYEVTVARFREFQEAAVAWQEAGHPADGDGAHPDVPESGWRTSWLDIFESTFAEGLVPTWNGYPEDYVEGTMTPFQFGVPTYLIEGADALAVNFVPFHIAFAFCIWDGGRLPAEAEWLHAASGGEAPSSYVWGDTPTPEEMFAVIPTPTLPAPHDHEFWAYQGIPVGSHPASDGRFGQSDLVSGLAELLRDRVPDAGEETGGLIELSGDENISGFSFGDWRALINASWQAPGAVIQAKALHPGNGMHGFRCARDPQGDE